MKRKLIEWSGWVPAIIIPVATILQLIQIFNAPTAEGVSWLTWLLFGLSNVGFYFFTEKYTSVQSILGFLGTALIDFVIVALVLIRNGS